MGYSSAIFLVSQRIHIHTQRHPKTQRKFCAMPAKASSIDQEEIARFARDSARWWDETGPFRPLHRLNPVRIGYIRQRICERYGRDERSLTPFKGLAILDIGCGGGLACEPMARLGADVTGIDADRQAIDVAKDHAEKAGLDISYLNTTAETLLHRHPREGGGPAGQKPAVRRASPDPRLRGDDDKGKYDVILALEIIEHVANSESFVQTCADLCRPGGLVVFSTLNRTTRSFALGIVAAEYMLGWVPRGTHDWRKFVRPSELSRFARQAGLEPSDVTGLVFNPLKNDFVLSKADMAVNYFLTAEKNR
jgi:2-polyprenyl-6-hydroxyphenyl methylase/3-demethylubiquinone-9 3-methyltransferase